jgi:hypothetical protein
LHVLHRQPQKWANCKNINGRPLSQSELTTSELLGKQLLSLVNTLQFTEKAIASVDQNEIE